MALTNYGELKASVASWLARSDLTAAVPDFITLAETKIRSEQNITTEMYSDANNGNAFAYESTPMDLPTYVRRLRAVWANTASHKHPIRVTTADEYRSLVGKNLDATGVPEIASVFLRGSQFGSEGGLRLRLWPKPAESFDLDLQYVRDFAALTNDTDTNTILTYFPGAYLFGALLEAEPFIQHDERLAVWERKYAAAMRALNIEAGQMETGASLKRARLPRSF